MVRSLYASGLTKPVIAALLDVNGKALDYAERRLKKPGRDSKARARLAYAVRRMGDAGKAAVSRGVHPEEDRTTLRAMSAFLRAHAAVLRAEPEAREYRLPLSYSGQINPFQAISAEIERIERKLTELTERWRRTIVELVEQRERQSERERAAARDKLANMTTREYELLGPYKQAEVERELELGLDRRVGNHPLYVGDAPSDDKLSDNEQVLSNRDDIDEIEFLIRGIED
jgi:hypothetical protein